MMGGYGVMWMGLGWLGMGLLTLLVLAALVLVVWGLSTHSPTGRAGVPFGPEPDALEILKRRYARGEISQAEYLQAREALQ